MEIAGLESEDCLLPVKMRLGSYEMEANRSVGNVETGWCITYYVIGVVHASNAPILF